MNVLLVLERLLEGVGTSYERVTRYGYDFSGKRSRVVKPDGVSLNYLYDALGRVREFSRDTW